MTARAHTHKHTDTNAHRELAVFTVCGVPWRVVVVGFFFFQGEFLLLFFLSAFVPKNFVLVVFFSAFEKFVTQTASFYLCGA